MLSQVMLVLTLLGAAVRGQERKWEFLQPRPVAQVQASPATENAFPAWYHMPQKQQQHAPAYPYERPPSNQQVESSFRGYPTFNRQPPSPPQQTAFETPRRPFPSTADIDDRTAVEKYHKLLLRKRKPEPGATSRPGHTVPPKLRPPSGHRPSTSLPRPGEPLVTPGTQNLTRFRTVRPLVNKTRERLRLKKIQTEATVDPLESSTQERTTQVVMEIYQGTTAPSFPITKESSPWHRLSWTRKSENRNLTTTTTTVSPVTLRPRFICNKTLTSEETKDREKRPLIGPFKPVSRTSGNLIWRLTSPVPLLPSQKEVVKPPTHWTVFDFISWPNAELFNAIRDVVNKFKASLDESGLDQDVRQMGRQLQNTWHQLRAGLDRSWNALRLSAEQSLHPTVVPYSHQGPGGVNEQLSQMFARSQSQDAPKNKL
ncbi:unnamed protein product, partial [Mesorhabditis spiculigera]